LFVREPIHEFFSESLVDFGRRWRIGERGPRNLFSEAPFPRAPEKTICAALTNTARQLSCCAL
jgi:hypothetical protein